MELSVIIPTHNRRDVLKRCLDSVLRQDCRCDDYEVVLVDDGSTDGTADAWREGLDAGTASRVKYIRREAAGPAAARNAGLRAARGRLALFLGDDIMAGPGLLDRHAQWHAANPGVNFALLGYVTWSPGLKATPFMKWLEAGGPQFGYYELEDGKEADPARFFYTCNVSVKRDFMLSNGMFDEDFRWAAYEDLELGLRLKEKGLKLYYERGAAAWHEHMTSLSSACGRMLRVGEAGELFRVKRGGTGEPAAPSLLLRLLRPLRFAVYYPLARLMERAFVCGPVFKYVMWYYRRLGAERFWEERRRAALKKGTG